jgi:hypothetical protein
MLPEKGKWGLISQRNGKPDPERAKSVQENQRLEELMANLPYSLVIKLANLDRLSIPLGSLVWR